ncbi:MAG: hypothetical protein K5683_03290 [Prevotella sp.]|nr:hypothetical protein [Prevotella sp.]
MEIYIIKKICEQIVTINDFNEVGKVERKLVINNLKDDEEIELTLIDDDALVPLKVGQKVLIELRCESYSCYGKRYYHYYALSISPLEDNAKIVYHKDYTTRLV